MKTARILAMVGLLALLAQNVLSEQVGCKRLS